MFGLKVEFYLGKLNSITQRHLSSSVSYSGSRGLWCFAFFLLETWSFLVTSWFLRLLGRGTWSYRPAVFWSVFLHRGPTGCLQQLQCFPLSLQCHCVFCAPKWEWRRNPHCSFRAGMMWVQLRPGLCGPRLRLKCEEGKSIELSEKRKFKLSFQLSSSPCCLLSFLPSTTHLSLFSFFLTGEL